MSPTDERAIPLSKTKIIILMLGAWMFVALGIWLFGQGENVPGPRVLGELLTAGQFLGGLSVAFFGVCGAFAVRKLLDKKPGLILNSAGLVDNSSVIATGLVPWSDITGLDLFELQKQRKLLVILVRDPQSYLKRGNAMVRALKRVNYNLCGSPVVIYSRNLKINLAELQSLLNRYREKYG
jgi:hypothetical protein